jgi:hypothetical protein
MGRPKRYEFAFAITGGKHNRVTEDALFEAGCDDALLASRTGRMFLEFHREALSLVEAILSAIRDVRRAGLGVLRVDEAGMARQASDVQVINAALEFQRQERSNPELARLVLRAVGGRRTTGRMTKGAR